MSIRAWLDSGCPSYAWLSRRHRPSRANVRSPIRRHVITWDGSPCFRSGFGTISNDRPPDGIAHPAIPPLQIPSARVVFSRGERPLIRSSTGSAPPRSRTSAACTTTAGISPRVSTSGCRSRPETISWAPLPLGPPGAVAPTLRLSRMAMPGLVSRPDRRRTRPRRVPWSRCRVPPLRHSRESS